MKKVLILGAGMISKPIISYLLEKGKFVTVATQYLLEAQEKIMGHPNGNAVEWTVDKTDELEALVAQHDITVSLLPWIYHVMVAKCCIKHRKDMLTTSYVKPEMHALHTDAENAGILILNELGLDPGIDHMGAMRIIDHIHGKGGSVDEFYSICGALPAPEAANNPFRYKFSWSPKGVVMAGNNNAKFLRNGNVVDVPTKDLFKKPLKILFPEVGSLEIYPNRDSMPYIALYGIPEVKTMMRGTFRHPGWCESMDAMKALGLITQEKYDFTGKSYAEMVAMLIGADKADSIRKKVANYLGLPENAHALDAMLWLGVFDNAQMNRTEDSPFEITSDLMMAKMGLGSDDRDMVVMQHVFLASYPNGVTEVIKSSMLDFGTPASDTAVARTVALPAAIGVEMILENKISAKGVQIPIIPEIYNPILDALAVLKITMVEEFGLPKTENIQ